jgi:hypothetical protein
MHAIKVCGPRRMAAATQNQLKRQRNSWPSGFLQLIALAVVGAVLTCQHTAWAWDVYSDNFDGGPPDTGWGHYNPIHSASAGYPLNTYTFAADGAGGQAYHLQATANTFPALAALGPARTIAYRPDNYGNFNITADLLPGWAGGGGVNGSYVQVMGLVGRLNNITTAPGYGQLNGYAFVYLNCDHSQPASFAHNALAILRIDHELNADVPGSGNGDPGQCYLRNQLTLDNSRAYRFQFIGKGTHLQGRVYELPNTTTPIVVLDADTAGDSVKWANGLCGILGVNQNNGSSTASTGPVDMTWDNYTASIHSPYEIRDNFNDGNDTLPAPAWARQDPLASTPLYPAFYSGATFSFPGGSTYQLTSPQLDPSFGAGNPRASSLRTEVQYTDFYVSTDMVGWDTAHHQEFGLCARVQTPGPGTTSGYLLGYDTGNQTPTDGEIDVLRIQSEGQTDATQMEEAVAGQDSHIHLNAGTHYRFTLSGQGPNLRAKVFQFPDLSTPIKDLLALDILWPTVVASGYAGVFVFNHPSDTTGNACTVTVDNFYADTAEPAIAMSDDGLGHAVLTWPATLASIWTLQTSSDVSSAAVWTTISGDAAKAIAYSATTGMNTYTNPAPILSATSTFFRLQRLDPIAYP